MFQPHPARRRPLADTAARALLWLATAALLGLLAAMFTRAADEIPALLSTTETLRGM